ncbi:hypothetical protein IV57_GL002012 [Companilactobacillus kimchiensis]|uniref:Uncharacterized protein n=1 Tax=Companilactobacillus kimchiensis TaxID=993692 RepID=A0A0R2KZ77_9LACO|nr:hypothetical protein IV57_GL002012 [Companilactobacillus kimchiensis]
MGDSRQNNESKINDKLNNNDMFGSRSMPDGTFSGFYDHKVKIHDGDSFGIH